MHTKKTHVLGFHLYNVHKWQKLTYTLDSWTVVMLGMGVVFSGARRKFVLKP
jgi:hypothetical protein